MPFKPALKYTGNTRSSPSSDDLRAYIEPLIDSKDQNQLLSLSDDAAQFALDLLWERLSSLRPSSEQLANAHRTQLRRLAIRLVMAYDMLPQALRLHGVECLESDASFAGSMTDIHRGRYADKDVALKRLRVYLQFTGAPKTQMRQEFHCGAITWKTLSHSHVMPFLGISEGIFGRTLCMVVPWMENGTIIRHIRALRDHGQLSGSGFSHHVNNWIRQIASGLAYLHSEDVMHGNLRGNNILITLDGKAQIADFDMTRMSETFLETYASIPGEATRWYSPERLDPELFDMDSNRPTCASDVYSFACACVELYTLEAPFSGINNYKVGGEIVKGNRPLRPTSPDGEPISDRLWNVITQCWAQQPSQRPSADEVVHMAEQVLDSAMVKSSSVPPRSSSSQSGKRFAKTPTKEAMLPLAPTSTRQKSDSSGIVYQCFNRWFRRTGKAE
ncbi:kinase-like domain-containing protein [Cristinia sonorae]|uniref:Kinase-like domain-containing protein n=1 Tax=Cristinia sonorae TaxID=1940300 RepID=A0A8K0UQA2_9AGAR|nr:kinase-like domain-containing protein [Cristinia sonorae]